MVQYVSPEVLPAELSARQLSTGCPALALGFEGTGWSSCTPSVPPSSPPWGNIPGAQGYTWHRGS